MEPGERTALLAILMNLAIFAIKMFAAAKSGSLALKAEAFHTLADLIASLTAFIGIIIARRKSKSFPYGLYKLENLISVIIALVIIFTSYEIITDVFGAKPIAIENIGIAAISLIMSIGLTFFFSRYERKIGLKINSPILLADAAHVRTDLFSNGIVLLAIASNWIGLALDRFAAIVVALLIAWTGLHILIDGIRVLLDASIDYRTLRKVEQIILDTPQVVQLKSLTGRNSGRFKFIEASIVIKTHSLERAYFIINQIEQSARQEITNIDRVLIHYEPLQKEEMVYAFPLAEDRASISPHFGEAPFFMLVTYPANANATQKIVLIENPFDETEKGKGILAAELLSRNKTDVIFVQKGFGSKGPSYVFSSENIEVVVTDASTPQQALASLGLSLDTGKGKA